MKIVFTDYYYPDNRIELDILNTLNGVEIVDLTSLEKGGIKDAERLIPYIKDADAIIVQFADISAKVINSLEKCKIIARYAIGVDNIDVAAAKAKGITVSNVPDYCIEEVSDTAMAHILNSYRSVSLADSLLRSDSWSLERIVPLKRLSESTVGLVAFGNIARRTAEKLRGFTSHILAADPYFSDTDAYPWVTFTSLETLLKESDIISVHAPLTASTRHLIGKKEFALMKKGAYIINTSRGGLIDESALIDALNENHLGGVGLDVLDTLDSEYPRSEVLKAQGKVTITPHLSWYSETSIEELKRKVALNVKHKLTKGKALYEL